MNHLNKRWVDGTGNKNNNRNIESRTVLESKVEFIQMSDCIRLYFDDKNIMLTNKSSDDNLH